MNDSSAAIRRSGGGPAGKLAAALWLSVALASLPWSANADLANEESHARPPVELVYFYMDGCPACTQAQALLDELVERYPQLAVLSYRLPTTAGREMLGVLRDVYQLGDITIPVPSLFVGGVAVVGRVFYGLAEEPFGLSGPGWALGVEEAVLRAVAAGASFVRRSCHDELGFCIGHPLDWEVSVTRPGTVAFSGGEGTEAALVNVSVQGFPPSESGASGDEAAGLILRYKYGLVLASPSVCIDGSAYPDGDGYVAEYTLSKTVFRQWRIAVAHGDALLSWAYTAPKDRFEQYRPMAEAMLATWQLLD